MGSRNIDGTRKSYRNTSLFNLGGVFTESTSSSDSVVTRTVTTTQEEISETESNLRGLLAISSEKSIASTGFLGNKISSETKSRYIEPHGIYPYIALIHNQREKISAVDLRNGSVSGTIYMTKGNEPHSASGVTTDAYLMASGNYLFIGISSSHQDKNNGLIVADVSDVTNMRLISSALGAGENKLPGYTRQENYLLDSGNSVIYSVSSTSPFRGLYVWDISDVNNVTIRSSGIDNTIVWSPSFMVAHSTGLLMTGSSSSNIAIWDISNLDSPYYLKQVSNGNFSSVFYKPNVNKKDNHLLLLLNSQMATYDISDPGNPTIDSTASYGPGALPVTSQSMYIQNNNYAYWFNDDAGFEVTDITDMSSISRIGAFSLGGKLSKSFYRSGRILYDNKIYVHMGDTISLEDTLEVIDISNPTSPTYTSGSPIFGGWTTKNSVYTGAQSGSLLFIGSEYNVSVWDTEYTPPLFRGAIYDSGIRNVRNMQIFDNGTMLTTSLNQTNNSFVITSLNNLDDMEIIATSGETDLKFVKTTAISGNYLFAGNYNSKKLLTFDITSPNIILTNTLTDATYGGNFESLCIDDRYLYGAANWSFDYISVYDISNPNSPQLVGSGLAPERNDMWYFTGKPASISGVLYCPMVHNNERGVLAAYDVTSGPNLTLISYASGEINGQDAFYSVTIDSNNSIAICADATHLYFFDISNPSNITELYNYRIILDSTNAQTEVDFLQNHPMYPTTYDASNPGGFVFNTGIYLLNDQGVLALGVYQSGTAGEQIITSVSVDTETPIFGRLTSANSTNTINDTLSSSYSESTYGLGTHVQSVEESRRRRLK